MSRALSLVDALLPQRCLACATPTSSMSAAHAGFCAVCAEQMTPSSSTSFVYAGPLADVIRRAKYGRDVASARGISRWWSSAIAGAVDVDAIAFVPAHWTRRVLRGFDLPALLAASLSSSTTKPLVDVLVAGRRDPRLAESASRDERARIVAGRFTTRGALAALSGKRVALVDDVKTTGATTTEAARVLTDAGVVVVPLTMAETPLQSAGVAPH